MQAAGEIAAVANGGIFHRPYYVDRIVKSDGQLFYQGKPETLSRLQLKDGTWELIREGLRSVVLEGTARSAKIEGAEVFGKTGTAQNPQGKDHAWFVAYATINDEPSKIAVAVLVEHGEHGASAAAPIAKAVIEAALRAELPSRAKPARAPALPQDQKPLLPPATHAGGVL
jgi:penicillin-binding protein 2